MSKLFVFLNMSYCQSSFHIKQKKMILGFIQNSSTFYLKEQEVFGENELQH